MQSFCQGSYRLAKIQTSRAFCAQAETAGLKRSNHTEFKHVSLDKTALSFGDVIWSDLDFDPYLVCALLLQKLFLV